MAVINVFQLAQAKMGLNPADPNQRNTLVRYLNEAAYELYIQADVAGSLMEQVFKVNGDVTVSLPAYVGEIRAIREYSSFIPWSINQMRPRYNQSNWNDFWRNWRLKGLSPLMASVTNASVAVVTIPQALIGTASLNVTLSGPTATATLISEVLTFNSTSGTSLQSVNQFKDFAAVTKNAITTYDVTMTDIDGKILTIIPNNLYAAKYQVIDVSTCPWLNNSQGTLDHYVEVLYKKALPVLYNDSDEYPAIGFDHIVANKMLQIWAQEQGKVEEALAYDQLCTRSLARRHEEENRATEDVIALVENPHDQLNPRVRSRRPSRYGGYSTTTRYGVM